ncbi:MAG: family 10 glycosylhydrolase [Cyanobacteria bacterium HKST-UBA06]|nr:family 10 glycosylhydrolase [Cyanobacteria bacterium HKST-UBA06]
MMLFSPRLLTRQSRFLLTPHALRRAIRQWGWCGCFRVASAMGLALVASVLWQGLLPWAPAVWAGEQLVVDGLEVPQFTLDVTNPTVLNNPVGASFPGLRGGDQLIRYDAGYGQPSTGTNEYGYEVTVEQGRVVRAEGADSRIPASGQGYVLSGHGRAKTFLIAYAPVGARITMDAASKVVTSTIDQDTYAFQVRQLIDKLHAQHAPALDGTLKAQVDHFLATYRSVSLDEAKLVAGRLAAKLEPRLWASYSPFSSQAVRGIWHRPQQATHADIAKTLDQLKATGINTVFLETYLHGAPLFQSSTFAAYGIQQTPPFALKDDPEADLLQVWLDEAHQRGLKVHVWFQTFYAGNRVFKQGTYGEGAILSRYPQWANRAYADAATTTPSPSAVESGHFFLDPANEEVQQFLLAFIDELLTRYDVDGFQLDYIRYPASLPTDHPGYLATTWGYTPVARTAFETLNGVDPLSLDPDRDAAQWQQWSQFKTDQVTRFVKRVHELVYGQRRLRHHARDYTAPPHALPLTAAVFTDPEQARLLKHQDWQTWAQSGWVDALAPMTLTSSIKTVGEVTRRFHQVAGVPVYSGIFGPFNSNTATHVVEQVGEAKAEGADGIILFDTAHLTSPMQTALRLGLFELPKPQGACMPQPTSAPATGH